MSSLKYVHGASDNSINPVTWRLFCPNTAGKTVLMYTDISQKEHALYPEPAREHLNSYYSSETQPATNHGMTVV